MTTKNNTYLKGLFIMDREKCVHDYHARETRYNDREKEIYRRYQCSKCGDIFYTVEFEDDGPSKGLQKCDACKKRYSVQRLGGNVPEAEACRTKRCLKCGATIHTVEFKVIDNKLFKRYWTRSYWKI